MLSKLIMRPIYTAFKQVPKLQSSNIEREGASIIVDPEDFKAQGIVLSLLHKFRNSSTLFELRRSIQGFETPKFEQEALHKYQQLWQVYEKRNYRDIQKLVSSEHVQNFKSECKRVKKQEELNLGWNLLSDVNSAKLVQMRMHQEKLTSVKVSDRWFQMICKFSNARGQSVYSLLEKHEKNEQFKFKKFSV